MKARDTLTELRARLASSCASAGMNALSHDTYVELRTIVEDYEVSFLSNMYNDMSDAGKASVASILKLQIIVGFILTEKSLDRHAVKMKQIENIENDRAMYDQEVDRVLKEIS